MSALNEIVIQALPTFVLEERKTRGSFTFDATCIMPDAACLMPNLDVRRSELRDTIQKFLNKKDVSPNLNQKTIDIAKAVANCLPSFALEPDSVYPTTLGDIDFEWIFSKDNMLSLEISQDGEIVHSKISKTRGTEKWNGELPSVVSRWFEDLQVYLNKANG